jgi:hypothetical protein
MKLSTLPYKNSSLDDLILLINNNSPISLKYNEKLIEKIHDRYPYLSKHDIALIVQSTFSVMRELLLKDNVLHLGSFMSKLYIKIITRATPHQGTYMALKVKASSINLKKINNV